MTIARWTQDCLLHTLQRCEAVGVGLNSNGLDEIAGDGVAEATAILVFASSSNFFSSG